MAVAARVRAALAGAPARSTLAAGGEAVAAMVAAVVVVAVAVVHTGMRAAVGMAAHGTTPAMGRIGATAIENL